MLPVLNDKLQELTYLQAKLEVSLDGLIPDWKALSEFVSAMDSEVDSNLVTRVTKLGDTQELLSLKKAIDRDVALIKAKVVDEEEKISNYTVSSSGMFLMHRNTLRDEEMIIRLLYGAC